MKGNAPLSHQWRLGALAASACYLLIVLGTVVRVTGSGEGCPGWPLCYGAAPLWRLHSVIEYAHRVLASVVTVLVVLTVVVVWRGGHRPRHALVTANLAVALLGIQIGLGGVTVLTHLSWPLVALHLATALALLGTLIALTLLLRRDTGLDRHGYGHSDHGGGPRHPGVQARLAIGTAALLVMTYVTAIAGAVVVGTESDLACTAWPACSPQAFFPQTAQQIKRRLARWEDAVVESCGLRCECTCWRMCHGSICGASTGIAYVHYRIRRDVDRAVSRATELLVVRV